MSPSAIRRRAWLLEAMPAPLQFAAGILALPAFLLAGGVAAKAALALLYLALGWLGGRRVRPLFALGATALIVAFNCLFPSGRVLAELGGLVLTEGALLGGLDRALVVEGLLFLSQATIRADLRLPGRFGGLLGRSLGTFERLSAARGSFDAKRPFASIDSILLSLYDSPLEEGAAIVRRPRPVAIALAAIAPAASWIAAAIALAGSA